MDLKSLLNHEAATAGQLDSTASPNRASENRTPWSAGGYSLPILTNPFSMKTGRHYSDLSPNNLHDSALESVEIHRSQEWPGSPIETFIRPRQMEDSQEGHFESMRQQRSDSLHGPYHLTSGSRGSLSSFASSSHSASHSRFSSISTLSGCHSLYNIDTDVNLGERQELLDSYHLVLSSPSTCSTSVPTLQTRANTFSSPELPSVLRPIAEHHFEANLQEKPSGMRVTNLETADARRYLQPELEGKDQALPRRAVSPSDALIIRRPTTKGYIETAEHHEEDQASTNHYGTENYTGHGRRTRSSRLKSVDFSQPSNHFLHVHDNHHQRTFSTPILATAATVYESRNGNTSKPIFPMSELTPPPSSHPDNSTNAHSFLKGPDTPPVESPSALPEPRCMFMEGCDTNSVPRKAVSHVFGRNKMCTRLIPPHVWVRYCRKHYQRAVYRNPKGWPKLQCDLVQEQIRRLETWTSENIRKGEGSVVKDWTLALRRREQVRRESLTTAEGNNTGTTTVPGDDSEDDGPKHRRSGGHPPIAVPDWLFDLCGSGYSSKQIAEIIDRIHRNILDETLPGIPDIEFLPNIETDAEESKNKRGAAMRKPTTHKRSQSLGVFLKHEAHGVNTQEDNRHESRSPILSFPSPSTKRKRNEDHGLDGYAQCIPPSHRMRLTTRDQSHRHHHSLNATSQHLEHPTGLGLINAFIGDPSHTSAHHHASLSSTPITHSTIPNKPAHHIPWLSTESLEFARPSNAMNQRPIHQRSQSDINALHVQTITFLGPPPAHSSCYASQASLAENPNLSRGHSWAGEQISTDDASGEGYA